MSIEIKRKILTRRKGERIMKIDTEKLDLAICKKGMMLKDIAHASRITEQAFRNIRTGKSEPKLSTLGRIASALGVNVKDIIKDGED